MSSVGRCALWAFLCTVGLGAGLLIDSLLSVAVGSWTVLGIFVGLGVAGLRITPGGNAERHAYFPVFVALGLIIGSTVVSGTALATEVLSSGPVAAMMLLALFGARTVGGLFAVAAASGLLVSVAAFQLVPKVAFIVSAACAAFAFSVAGMVEAWAAARAFTRSV